MAQLFPGGDRILHRRLKCFGTGESHLEAQLPDLIRRGRDPSVGITVHEGTITLRISGRDPSAIDQTEQLIRQTLGPLVFGTEEDELPDAIARLMAQRPGATLAVAEWTTAGLVTQWLGDCQSLGPAWRGGIVVSDQSSVAALLGIEGLDEISQQSLADRMAVQLRQSLGVDFALAVGPPPSSTAAQVPQLALALAADDVVRSRSVPYAAHSAIVKPLAAKRALDLVRRELL